MSSALGFICANIGYQLFGALWYSPLLMGSKWQKQVFGEKGIPQKMKDDPTPFFVSVVLGLISSIILDRMQVYGGVDTVENSVVMGCLVGGVYVCHASIAGSFKFLPASQMAIETAQVFASTLIMSVCLCYFKST